MDIRLSEQIPQLLLSVLSTIAFYRSPRLAYIVSNSYIVMSANVSPAVRK
jgi:hypothetical protein